jgi:prephenate dehydrogenase
MTDGTVAVIGLGLIGGSLARALQARGVSVRAWSVSAEDRELAASAGIAVSADAGSVMEGATTVVFAVPIDRLGDAARSVFGASDIDVAALHAGGLQRQSAVALDDRLSAAIVGTHPLAGSHDSGFAAARDDLFSGATVSVESRADESVRSRAEWVWRTAGAARLVYRSAEEHDRLMAWVSHLPQLASTALAATLAGCGIDPHQVGPGARDATRLAASPFEQWQPLLAAAPADLTVALRMLEERLARLRGVLESGDTAELATAWTPARAWRRDAEPGA